VDAYQTSTTRKAAKSHTAAKKIGAGHRGRFRGRVNTSLTIL
jgi:hypothetical protein